MRKNNIKKKKSLLNSDFALPSSFDVFFFFLSSSFSYFFMWDPHVHFIPLLVRLSPETNYFVPVSILFILIEYSLNIFYFSEFFKNPVFRFHSKPVA